MKLYIIWDSKEICEFEYNDIIEFKTAKFSNGKHFPICMLQRHILLNNKTQQRVL